MDYITLWHGNHRALEVNSEWLEGYFYLEGADVYPEQEADTPITCNECGHWFDLAELSALSCDRGVR